MDGLLLATSNFTIQTFVSGLWQGCALVFAVALCLRLLPRLSASIRFGIWSLTFALVVTLPFLHLRVPAERAHGPVIHIHAIWGFVVAALWALLMAVRAVQLVTQAIHLRRIWKWAKPAVAGRATLALL